MRLCKEFLIKDLLQYDSDINIFDELEQCNLFVITDLIKLGNKCSDEEAENILNRALVESSLEQLVESLVYEIIGREPTENSDNTSSKNYTSLSEILLDFYNSVQACDSNLSYTEFLNMNTKTLYQYADGVQARYIKETNAELEMMFMDKVLLGQMMAGKLKDCPRLDEDGTLHKETLQEKLAKLKGGVK